MKFKLWQGEYDFDKDDAKIVIPLVLLLLGLGLTHLKKEVLFIGGVVYYLLYFFLKACLASLKELIVHLRFQLSFKCPYCKSREVVLQGYQGYHSDEQYGHYLCNRCRKTSVLVNERLIKTS